MANVKKRKLTNLPTYCEICGYSTFVTKHRILPGRKGGTYSVENTIVLCPNDHKEADEGLISPLVLYQIVYDRIKAQKELEDKNGSTNGT